MVSTICNYRCKEQICIIFQIYMEVEKMEEKVFDDGLEGICDTSSPKIEDGAKRKSGGLKVMDRRMIVNAALVLAGITAGVTGIMMQDSGGYQGGRNAAYSPISAEARDIHDVSGYLFLGLGALHLAQHYEQIKCYTKYSYNRLAGNKDEDILV